MYKYAGLLLAVILFWGACSLSKQQSAENSITKESLMAHISVLASDDFQGRSTGTAGEVKAANYIVQQMKDIGAVSGVSDGSYLQKFPLLGQKTGQDTKLRASRRGQNTLEFNYFDDFMAWPANQAEKGSVSNAEMVFVGYGIQAPEEDWDDFKGVDVKGKVLIIKNNDPETLPGKFGENARLYYGRYTYKYEKAKEMGALGVLIIHTTPSAGYGWNVVSNSWSRERFYLKESAGGDTKFNGWITEEASEQLFRQSGLNLNELMDSAESPDFKPVALSGRLSLELSAEYREIDAMNVVGVIEGSDPVLKNEFLVLSAHFDHLGITVPVNADSINNGAEDNAAGVAAMLEMGKAYASMAAELKRSVILLAVSAEEVGLLGSAYWASTPTVPLGKVTGNINLDGMNVYGLTSDIVIIGKGRNGMSALLEEVAAEAGVEVFDDSNPSAGIFYRSDHFSLAKAGVPAIFPNPGSRFIGKPEGFTAVRDSVKSANYHSVNDEVNEFWDLSGAQRDTRLFFRAGLRALNAPGLQAWKKGDEFEAARLKSLN